MYRLFKIVVLFLILTFKGYSQNQKSDSLQLKSKRNLVDSSRTTIEQLPMTNITKYDTVIERLNREIFSLRTDVKHTKANLYAFQRQYRTGTGMIIASYFALFAAIASSSISNKDVAIPVLLTVGGSISMLIGNIVRVDAHRFLGYAGKPIKPKKK